MYKLFTSLFFCLALSTLYCSAQQAKIKSTSCGSFHTLLLQTNGKLWACGGNSHGQLGDGTNADKTSLTRVGSDSDWVFAAAGRSSSYGIKSNGTLWAWGENTDGQLGDGTNNDQNTPIQIGSDNDWLKLSAFNHVLGLKKNGALWSWGYNNNGALGNGNTSSTNTPARVGTDSLWADVSAAFYHSLFRKANGTLWACGYNSDGELGDGTKTDQDTLIQVGSSSNWTAIATGNLFSMGVNSGELYSWGWNNSGQLGHGNNTSANTPTKVGNTSNWKNTTCGSGFAYGLKTDGTIWSWGDNANGQLGSGNNTNRTSPAQVGSNTKWVNVAAANFHVFCYKDDSLEVCRTGSNFYGALADNTYSDRNDLYCSQIPCEATAIPAPPSASGKTICYNTSAALSTTGSATVYWFSTQTGSTVLATGDNYNTPLLTSTSTYYLMDSNCMGGSSRSSVTVNVNAALDSSVTVGDSTLKANLNGATYQWNTCSAGTHTTIAGETNQIYYPTASGDYSVTVTINGCSATSACTNLKPCKVIQVTPPAAICSGTKANITATGTGSLSWYDAATAGNWLYTGTSFTTPALTANTTYYIQDTNCVGKPRTSVVVSVFTVSDSVTIIDSVTIKAFATGAAYQWVICNTGGTYADIAGATNQQFKVPYINNMQYAVRVTQNGCTKISNCTGMNPCPAAFIGVRGFSTNGAKYVSIAINGSREQFVAYSSANYPYKATVMKYSGGAWAAVGTVGFSAGSASYVSLAINGFGEPLVAYQDGANAQKATVMKYSGGAWAAVGTAGFSA